MRRTSSIRRQVAFVQILVAIIFAITIAGIVAMGIGIFNVASSIENDPGQIGRAVGEVVRGYNETVNGK